MKHYYDSVLQVRSGLTIPGPGVSITVNLQGTQTAATIYSDDGVTTKANPLTTDANGRFDFYVANGRYDLIFAGTGFANFTQFNVEITDAMDTTALGKTPIAFTAANTHSGSESFTGSLNIPTGPANPATCAQGALFYNTTTGATQNCTAPNIWSTVTPTQLPGVFNQLFDPPLFQNYTLTVAGAQTGVNLTATPIDTHTLSWRLGSNGLPTSITDTIPYANGDLHTANANWVYQAGTFTVSSNVVYGQATTALAYRSDGPNTSNEWAQITAVNGGGGNAQLSSVCVRVQTGSSSAYCAGFTAQSPSVFRLWYLNAGALTTLFTFDNVVPSTGDTIKLVANGSTLSVYKNGACIQPCGIVDTNLTTGFTGIYSNANATVDGASNFQSGTIVSCNVQLDSSPDGTTWTSGGVIASQPCVALNGSIASGTFQGIGPVNNVRVNLTALTAGQTLQVVYSGRLAPSAPNTASAPVSNGQFVQPGQVIWYQYTSQGSLAAFGVHASTNILLPNGQTVSTNMDVTCGSGANGIGFAVTAPGWLQSATTYVTSLGYPQGSVYANIYILNGMPLTGSSTACTGNLGTTQIGALLAGMPTGSFYPVSFIGTTAALTGPWSIPGYTSVLSPTNPAAGAEWITTLSSTARTCVQDVSFTAAAGSTNITPTLLLKFQNNAGGNVQTLAYSASTAQTSATTQNYSFSPGASAELVTGTSPIYHIVPFNNGQMVCGNAGVTVTIGTLTAGLNGTTAYTAIAITTQVQQDNN